MPDKFESSKKYYSKKNVADEYDNERFATTGGKMFDEFEKKVVISNLPKNSKNIKILDAGAGSGRFTVEIANLGYNVVSCDFSQAMLETISTKIEKMNLNTKVELSQQDILDLKFDDNEFDFICCMRVSVNLDTRENLIKGLLELIRVCKPGGVIVFDVVNPMSIAILGSTKESMIKLNEVKRLLDSIPEIERYQFSGRRILSQTIFEKTPLFLLGLVDKVDLVLSNLFPGLCVRIYFVIKK